MELKHPALPVENKFKTKLSEGKVMLTLFWDAQGPILECYEERVKRVNSALYCDMLQEQLKPAIQATYQGLLLKIATMLHDNACLRNAIHSAESLP
jgi:hypothetical protein